MEEKTWREAWDLKVFGFVTLTREIYRQMCARRRGVIVNVLGNAGERPMPKYVAGSMANSALMTMTRVMGAESLRHGVRVVGVSPGYIETDRQIVRWKARAKEQLGDENRWRELTAVFPLVFPVRKEIGYGTEDSPFAPRKFVKRSLLILSQ